jgi:DNA-binding NarL/FixJ family response regulator
MPSTPSSPDAPISVIVVEDDPSFRNAFAAAIRGTTDLRLAALAPTRSAALELLQGPACDVMVVDLGLPDGSGIDVIRAAQQAWPRCQIVVSTAFADESHVMLAIESGASGYLLKDSSPEGIVSEIRSLHGGGSPVSPFIARRLLQRLRAAPPSPSEPSPETGAALSPRETTVLELVAKGFAYDEIAARMGVSRHTVLTFVRRIYAKLEVNSKMEAVNEGRRQGVLPR